MVYKIQKYLLNSFIIILLFHSSFINSLKLNEKYPKSLYLSNKNLFLVTENGFRIYDPSLKNQIKNYDFTPDSRKITLSSEAALTSIAEFSDGTIIALVKKYLYIFDSAGEFKKEQDLTNILVNGIYYDLIAHKYDSNKYYYIISYYDSTQGMGPYSIKYCSFSFDSTLTIINPLYELSESPKLPTEPEENRGIQSCGLSCEIMNRNDQDVLTCFYQVHYPPNLGVSSFDIGETSFTKIEMEGVFSPNQQVSMIKSAISPDKKTAFICYTRYASEGKCLQYNIDNNAFTEETQYFSTCRDSANYMEVYYFKEKEEYMFMCVDGVNQKGFNVVKFNSDFEQISDVNPDTTDYSYGGNCYQIYSINMIYIPSIDDFILINDCEVDGSIISTGSINLEKLSPENNNNNYPLEEDIDIFDGKEVTESSEQNEETSSETNEETSSETNEETNSETNEETNSETNEEAGESSPETDSSTEENIENSEITEEKSVETTIIEKPKANNSVIIDTSTKSKEEIINDLDNLLLDKDPEQSYVINGDDFTVIIKPVNEVVEESTVHIDFSECENVLKEIYPEKEFRIMQINMENKNENCLTDQVEYKIYDQDGVEMDLSVCDEVTIPIEFEIKNTSLLNLEQISSFQDQGVDVFDINSEFFNDICYSYSDNGSDSDMILSDRVADIYQNFSICGDGCEYVSFNVEKKSANCECNVKQEVSSESETGNFNTYVMSAFLDSNFGIIKCFNLVFSIKGKVKNAGFWMFGLMILTHIPIYVVYIINGTTPVVKYISNEMINKGYELNSNNHHNHTHSRRSKHKKKSITPRMESNKKNMNDEQDSPSVEVKRYKKEINSNPPKNHNNSFSDNENKKKSKKIQFAHGSPKQYKNKKNVIILSENDGDKKKVGSRLDSANLETKDFLVSPRKTMNRNHKGKKQLKLSNMNTIDTNPGSPKNYNDAKKETKKHHKSFKDIKDDVLNLDKSNRGDGNKNKKAFSKKNNLVLELESGELLGKTNKNTLKNQLHVKKLNLRKISSKKLSNNKNKNSSKNIEPTIGDVEENSEKSEKKFERKNKKLTTQFPLILINASNSKSHQALKSNYVLDNYDYEDALENEKRSFCRIFFIYLISKENVLNIIFFNPPLELKPIRISVFIFSFACDFALNALFYLSDNISDKYHYTGSFRELFALVNNLTISLTSTIVSFILLYFFQTLTQSSKKIENLFRQQEQLLKKDKQYKVGDETIKEIKNNLDKIIKCLKVKIIVFIILEFILMIFFLYYSTAFCQVYPSTQVSWILDCISSYVISLAFTLVLSFLCASFYKIAIKYRVKILYKIILLFYSV
jgi:hypothetical protein